MDASILGALGGGQPVTNLQDIKLVDIDFDSVKSCESVPVLKRYLELLAEDGGYFVDLVKASKNRLFEVNPKAYYKMYPPVATAADEAGAIRDVLAWEDEMNEVDARLRNSSSDQIWETKAPQVAAVRGTAPVAARPHVHKAPAEPKAKAQPYARDQNNVKDYYRAWESFDVEALEEDFDEQEEKETRRKAIEEESKAKARGETILGQLPTHLPEEQRKVMAQREKEKADEAYTAKDWQESVEYYERAVALFPIPAAYANCALARMKLKDYEGAIADCDAGLRVEPKYMKVHHRRGKANFELGRYEEAVEDLQRASQLAEGNATVNADLKAARAKLRRVQPKAEQSQPKEAENWVVVPEGEEFKRVAIVEETDSDEEPVVEEVTKTGTTTVPADGSAFRKMQIVEESESDEEVQAPASPPKASPAKAAPASAGGFRKMQIVEESDSDEEVKAPASPPKASPAKAASPPAAAQTSAGGFRKMQIVEESDSDEEVTAPASPPKASPAKAAPASAGGFRKMQIVEESDSDEEVKAPASPPKASPAKAAPASAGGFRKMQIVEESDSDGDVNASQTSLRHAAPASPPKASPAKVTSPVSSPAKRRVMQEAPQTGSKPLTVEEVGPGSHPFLGAGKDGDPFPMHDVQPDLDGISEAREYAKTLADQAKHFESVRWLSKCVWLIEGNEVECPDETKQCLLTDRAGVYLHLGMFAEAQVDCEAALRLRGSSSAEAERLLRQLSEKKGYCRYSSTTKLSPTRRAVAGSPKAEAVAEPLPFAPKPRVAEAPPKPPVAEAADMESLTKLKNAGNRSFQAGDAVAAVRQFSECLAKAPAAEGEFRSILYANRALAYLRLEKWAEAEADATHAVDSGEAKMLTKARYRRAQARRNLSNLQGALQDVNAVLLTYENTTNAEAEALKKSILEAMQDKKKALQKKQIETKVPKRTAKVPATGPKNAYEIARNFLALKSHPDVLAEYVRERLPPAVILRCFKKSTIESDVLERLLDVVSKEGFSGPETVRDYLDAILATPSGETQLAMLSDAERVRVQTAAAGSASRKSDARVKKLGFA